MLQDYQFKAIITGPSEYIEIFVEKVNQLNVNTINWDDYHNFFEFVDNNFDWGTEWTSFEDKKYVQNEFFRIIGHFDSSPPEGFWRKIASEYKLNIHLEYKTPELTNSQILVLESEQVADDEKLTFLEFMFFYQNAIFWEKITEASRAYTYDEIMEIIGSLFIEFTEEEKNRLIALYTKKY